MELQGKVALVTGGGSGIGKAAAVRFAREGASVGVLSRTEDENQATVQEIKRAGGKAIALPADISDADQMRQAVERLVGTYGRLDIVFANAGINGVWAPIDELKPEEWDQTIAINLRGTYLTVHFAVPHLKRSGAGSIIITSSVNGTRTFSNPGASAYSTSKAGQIAFMKMIALELGRHNIRCNAICPGFIHTNIQQRTEQRATNQIGIEVELPHGSPAIDEGKGDPFEVADTCLFLASDLSRHVSGVEIYVDGGASLLR